MPSPTMFDDVDWNALPGTLPADRASRFVCPCERHGEAEPTLEGLTSSASFTCRRDINDDKQPPSLQYVRISGWNTLYVFLPEFYI
jgi:hypothetical protein